ncbi:hypothetical protein Tco_0647819 [Tanacetum coccineum]
MQQIQGQSYKITHDLSRFCKSKFGFGYCREVLPDVRSAYATISSEESHRVAAGSIAGQYGSGKSIDVKFFEHIFPFKDSEIEKNDSTNVLQDVNHINFFDIEYLEIPNDDERVENDLNRDKRTQSDSSSSSVSCSNRKTADFQLTTLERIFIVVHH